VLDDVTKQYGDQPPAVGHLSLTIPAGQITVLVGPSGCGKTTTLRMLNRMVEPTSGTITFAGEPLRRHRRTALRRRMGYVIQNGGLLPHRTVADNIATVPKLLGWDRPRTRQRVGELLDAVGLPREFGRRHPGALSGGQQQRVGVARALAAEPEVLLMDEPFSAVDPVVRTDLQDLVLGLQAERPRTVVMITHDIDEAIRLGDRVVLLDHGGRIAQNATPNEILNDPADEFVAAFVGRDRGWRTLSFHPAADLPVERVRAVRSPSAARAGTRAVVLDRSARPIGWVTPERPGKVINLGGTFDPVHDSLRVALDAALASPVGFAVAVEADTGRFTGAVSLETIMKQAAELRRTVSIDVLDAKEAEARRLAAEARREAAERARRQEAERARLLAEMAAPDGPGPARRRPARPSAAPELAGQEPAGQEPASHDPAAPPVPEPDATTPEEQAFFDSIFETDVLADPEPPPAEQPGQERP